MKTQNKPELWLRLFFFKYIENVEENGGIIVLDLLNVLELALYNKR